MVVEQSLNGESESGDLAIAERDIGGNPCGVISFAFRDTRLAIPGDAFGGLRGLCVALH